MQERYETPAIASRTEGYTLSVVGCVVRYVRLTLLQVRCDAASLGVPCTNCVAFSIECKIPTPKRKKTQIAGTGKKDSDRLVPLYIEVRGSEGIEC